MTTWYYYHDDHPEFDHTEVMVAIFRIPGDSPEAAAEFLEKTYGFEPHPTKMS